MDKRKKTIMSRMTTTFFVLSVHIKLTILKTCQGFYEAWSSYMW